MSGTIAKFGGSSVKTAKAIRQVAAILKDLSNLRLVVVSAIGGVTNLLVEFCSTSPSKREDIAMQILAIHTALASELELFLSNEINSKLIKLRELEVTEFTKAQIDNILALGEDLSCLIVHAFLERQGLNINKIDARDYIITDDHFGRAVPDIKVIEERAHLLPQGLCIMQGFIGSTKDGCTTTLGRGGSDYTAALMAEALQASEVLIYTDVPGVYTMDPNLISSVKIIEELSFHEMEEMANFGAKILCPATIEPCMRAQISIRILSTFDLTKPGTRVSALKANAAFSQIRAVTMRENQILVTVKRLKSVNPCGFLANIFSVLASHKISIDLITTSEVTTALTVDGTNLGSHGINPFIGNTELLRELRQFADILVETNITLVAVIGHGLMMPTMFQNVLGVIQEIPIRMVCYGASSSSICLLVKQDEAIKMAKKLHSILVEREVV